RGAAPAAAVRGTLVLRSRADVSDRVGTPGTVRDARPVLEGLRGGGRDRRVRHHGRAGRPAGRGAGGGHRRAGRGHRPRVGGTTATARDTGRRRAGIARGARRKPRGRGASGRTSARRKSDPGGRVPASVRAAPAAGRARGGLSGAGRGPAHTLVPVTGGGPAVQLIAAVARASRASRTST